MSPAENNNWLSFSLMSSMEMLNASTAQQQQQQAPTDSNQHYYSFADNFYATNGWPNHQKSDQTMYTDTENHHQYTSYDMQPPPPPPKLEDFFTGGGDSTETQDSTLTHIYNQQGGGGGGGGGGNVYFDQDLKSISGFEGAAFSANSGSEVDDLTHSPIESAGNDLLMPNYSLTTNTSNGLSLGRVDNNNYNYNNNNNTNTLCSENNNNIINNVNKAIVAVDPPENCKKIADTFGQRTSIYRGVTRHRWTGRYEAHLWDNSCRREGQARKGRQVYLGGYDKEEKAARSYDLAALKYWGSTATTNFPISNYSKEIEEMKNVTKQEFIASLRRKSSGFSRGASIYRGVTRHHQQGRWQARIGRVAGNKDLYLGTFATEEEAAEAYDIAAIKFRGINAVTNFEMNRYDVEAIAKSPLPIGGAAKRLKLSLEGGEKMPLGTILQAPCTSSSNISFASIQQPSISYDNTAVPYYHHNFFHQDNSGSMGPPMTLMQSPVGTMTHMQPPAEFFIWPNHQSY